MSQADADEGFALAPESESPPAEDSPSYAGFVHTAQAHGETPLPLAEAGQYYIGMWGSYANYGCPFCPHAVLGQTAEEGDGKIEMHILSMIERGDPRHLRALELE